MRSSSADHACTALQSVRSGNEEVSKSSWRFRALLSTALRRFPVLAGVAGGFLTVAGVDGDFRLAADAGITTRGRSCRKGWEEQVGAELLLQSKGPASGVVDAREGSLRVQERCVEGVELGLCEQPGVRLAQSTALAACPAKIVREGNQLRALWY